MTTAPAPDSPIVLMTRHQLQQMMLEAVELALNKQQQQQQDLRRIPTSEAAAYLGCRPNYLHTLHKRGLPYEKGRPNFYKFSDLVAYRATLRLGGTQ